MGILSIQSHVVYGYVGNKAAVYPLQSMGYDVWPINTVQFSNHTGYKSWEGQIFSREHIKNITKGLENLGVVKECEGILSGYMGSSEVCFEVLEIVKKFKAQNPQLLYLCDPVIGNNSPYIKPEVLDFFKKHLTADIITPNQFEAEVLSGIKIINIATLKLVAQHFHNIGVSIVVITGIQISDFPDSTLQVFVSDGKICYLITTIRYNFKKEISGTGDLFSALYLGSYIKSKSAIKSLQNTIYYIDRVMYNTFQTKSQELQVISINYTMEPHRELPSFILI